MVYVFACVCVRLCERVYMMLMGVYPLVCIHWCVRPLYAFLNAQPPHTPLAPVQTSSRG